MLKSEYSGEQDHYTNAVEALTPCSWLLASSGRSSEAMVWAMQDKHSPYLYKLGYSNADTLASGHK